MGRSAHTSQRHDAAYSHSTLYSLYFLEGTLLLSFAADLASPSSSLTDSCFPALPNGLFLLLFNQNSPTLSATLAIKIDAATPHIQKLLRLREAQWVPSKFERATHYYLVGVRHVTLCTSVDRESNAPREA